MTDIREWLDQNMPWFIFGCFALAASMWILIHYSERIAAKSWPEATGAKIERIGPRLELDGLYRVDYEGRVYLLYQIEDRAVFIQHAQTED